MPLSQALKEIRAWMLDRGDSASAEKIGQLSDKLRSGKMSIAFSGHFSAGKSSLINALCGKRLLPSGPIPTSANLVVIESGEEGALVARSRREGEREGEEEPFVRVSIDKLADYCKDGETYPRIEIRYPSELLGNRLCLLDTPGVDSTDAAHMTATESSLHLADAVFYVTDYNHVLSEMNLSFAKRLKDWGKPLYMIVNQVDKHREAELSFEAYKSNVKEAFRAWGVSPDGFMFISVKDPGHPNSEWGKLLWLIDRLKEGADTLLAASVRRSARYVAHEHVANVYPNRTDAKDASLAGEDVETISIQEAEARLTAIEDERRKREAAPEEIRSRFRQELSKLIDNAQIMPATTRDLAGNYLQSRKPGFKVGLLFSGSKTKAETASRLDELFTRLHEHVERQLVWHLNELIREFCEQYGDEQMKAGGLIPALETELSPEALASGVNRSASFTDEYTMTYCHQISERIKSGYRRKAADLFEAAVGRIELEAGLRLSELETEWKDAERRLLLAREARAKALEKQRYADKLNGELEREEGHMPMDWPDPDEAEPISVEDDAAIRMDRSDDDDVNGPQPPARLTDEQRTERIEEKGERFQYRYVMEETALALESGAELLAPVRSLAKVRSALQERADKLRKNRFTVALFGAFSAGKSSLTNALIGESVLPVSPNPTTAAINSILPPEEGHPHGTALIRMKSADTLLSDVRFSLSMLGLSGDLAGSVQEAAGLLRKWSVDNVPAKGKPHLSFLKAVETGYPEVREILGQTWTADYETYRRYVAEENKSCFVESIDLFYDTAFGEQGVVFVDTPGADSIHARHTGVTFNYIKNADAILFVTYYNHAFSQADKQFLLQLGRVKDAFELDKMFFVVNAADLAESAEELQAVLAYIGKQLLQNGIRHPRMFPVSSRTALAAKQTGDAGLLARSGIGDFERSFSRFAVKELASVTVRSAQSEMVRAAARFRNVLGGLQQGDEERKIRLEQIRELADQLEAELGAAAAAVQSAPVKQELTELLHHVKRRCYFRFGELYSDAFHPSVLQDDGRNIAVALQSAWKQLQQAAAVEASQELLSTTLRMEQFVRGKARGWREYAAGLIAARLPEFIGDEWEEPPFTTPAIGESLGSVRTEEKTIVKTFKNARSFFEGEGKAALKRILEEDVSAAVHAYIDSHAQQLSAYYEQWFAGSVRAGSEHFIRQLRLYIGQSSQAPEDCANRADLKNRLDRMEQYIRRFERES